MKTKANFHFDLFTVAYPLSFVLFIWIVFWAEVTFGLNFNNYGIQPGSVVGLRGVLFSPFIHGSVKHLYSNSLPLLFLSMALFYFYRSLVWKVLGFGILLSGLLTWFIGNNGTVHIGASGLIYVMASFLFFQGIWSHYYRLIALSLIIIFWYGSLVWGMLPGMGVAHISWEGHLSGFISGMFLAFCYRKNKIAKAAEKKYAWQRDDYREEDDPFMQHFDENGNFVPSEPEEEVENEVEVENGNEAEKYTLGEVEIIYEIIEGKEASKKTLKKGSRDD